MNNKKDMLSCKGSNYNSIKTIKWQCCTENQQMVSDTAHSFGHRFVQITCSLVYPLLIPRRAKAKPRITGEGKPSQYWGFKSFAS